MARGIVGLLLVGALLSGCAAAAVAVDAAFGAAGLWQREQHRRELERLRELQERRQPTSKEGPDGWD